MIPDLAHRVSVFGLLKPVACRICFDVTLIETAYIPMMSLSSDHSHVPRRAPVPREGQQCRTGGVEYRRHVAGYSAPLSPVNPDGTTSATQVLPIGTVCRIESREYW